MLKTVEYHKQVRLPLKDDDDFGPTGHLLCPGCGDEYTHLGKPFKVESDDYKAWQGRGSLVVIPGECESGCKFEICIGFHKGYNFVFAR